MGRKELLFELSEGFLLNTMIDFDWWGLFSVIACEMIAEFYCQVVHWRPNLYTLVPYGNVGKSFGLFASLMLLMTFALLSLI